MRAPAIVAAEPRGKSYLSVNNIDVIYNHILLVLKGVSLELAKKRIVALLSANRAGKKLPHSIRGELEMVYHYFPRLKARRTSQSKYTSGGEQQMTALGRAVMARLSMILLEEPSMSLVPQIIDELFGIVRNLNRNESVSFLLGEQNTNVALRFADYGYILQTGRVVMDDAAAQLAQNEDIKEFYLALSTAGHRLFRDVKHYRRRNRWLS